MGCPAWRGRPSYASGHPGRGQGGRRRERARLVRRAERTWRFGRIDLAGGALLEGDQTPVLNVPEAARTAVRLDAEGNELERLALALGDELVRLTF